MLKIRTLLAGAMLAACAVQANAQVPADGERMGRLEAQMRNLTGQIEQLTHSLGELQAQLKRIQDDNEFRFKSLESAAAPPPKGQSQTATRQVGPNPPAASTGAPPAIAAVPVNPAAAPAASAAVPPAGTDAIGALAAGSAPPLPQPGTQGPGAPPRSLGTVTIPPPPAGTMTVPPVVAAVPPANQPLDLSALAKGGGAVVDSAPLPQTVPTDQKAVASIAPSGDAQSDYKKAYELFVAGQYATSESAFRQFLASYPRDDRASDATYWLGQTLYSRGMYREAALEFVNGHKLYPKSIRAADTMLLLGKSLAGIPEREAACQTFAAALKQYPQMTPQLRQRIVSEQSNASC